FLGALALAVLDLQAADDREPVGVERRGQRLQERAPHLLVGRPDRQTEELGLRRRGRVALLFQPVGVDQQQGVVFRVGQHRPQEVVPVHLASPGCARPRGKRSTRGTFSHKSFWPGREPASRSPVNEVLPCPPCLAPSALPYWISPGCPAGTSAVPAAPPW